MEFAAERARLLFGCYRRGDANDPKTYVTAVAAVLADYPDETIRYVTDPRTGMASRGDWLPTVGEVKRACEDHYGPTRRAIDREAQERRQLAEREMLAIADQHPRKTYEELIEDCRARGLNIGSKKDNPASDVAGRQIDEANRKIFERECAAAGVDPKIGISPSLLKILSEQSPGVSRETEAA